MPKKIIFIAALAVAAMFAVSYAATCSSNSCVYFEQWQHGASATYCYKKIGIETWAFPDSCCISTTNPTNCTSLQFANIVGVSTVQKMDDCTAGCSGGGCASTKTQVYTSTSVVENINALRYRCASTNED